MGRTRSIESPPHPPYSLFARRGPKHPCKARFSRAHSLKPQRFAAGLFAFAGYNYRQGCRGAMKDLSDESQDALRGFLKVELELAPTLIALARTHAASGFFEAALKSLKLARV